MHAIGFFLSLVLFVMPLNDGKKANQAFEKGDYAQAEELYRKAISEKPEDSRLYFNLATTLAKQEGRTEEALQLFEQYKSMAETKEDRAKADYNIGKLMAEQQKWDQATKAFQQALMQDPSDVDAKHNFELSQQKQQQQQQQQDQQDQQDQQNQEQDQQQNEQQQQQDQNQQDQQDQNQQNQNQPQQDQQNQDQQQQQQQQQAQQQLSKQEAQKMLEALEKKEKDLLKNFKKKQTKPKDKNGKDW